MHRPSAIHSPCRAWLLLTTWFLLGCSVQAESLKHSSKSSVTAVPFGKVYFRYTNLPKALQEQTIENREFSWIPNYANGLVVLDASFVFSGNSIAKIRSVNSELTRLTLESMYGSSCGEVSIKCYELPCFYSFKIQDLPTQRIQSPRPRMSTYPAAKNEDRARGIALRLRWRSALSKDDMAEQMDAVCGAVWQPNPEKPLPFLAHIDAPPWLPNENSFLEVPTAWSRETFAAQYHFFRGAEEEMTQTNSSHAFEVARTFEDKIALQAWTKNKHLAAHVAEEKCAQEIGVRFAYFEEQKVPSHPDSLWDFVVLTDWMELPAAD